MSNREALVFQPIAEWRARGNLRWARGLRWRLCASVPCLPEWDTRLHPNGWKRNGSVVTEDWQEALPFRACVCVSLISYGNERAQLASWRQNGRAQEPQRRHDGHHGVALAPRQADDRGRQFIPPQGQKVSPWGQAAPLHLRARNRSPRHPAHDCACWALSLRLPAGEWPRFNSDKTFLKHIQYICKICFRIFKRRAFTCKVEQTWWRGKFYVLDTVIQ